MGLVGRVAESLQRLFLGLAEFRLGFGGGDLEKKKVTEMAGEVVCDAKGVAVAGFEFVNLGEGGLAVTGEDGGGKGAGFNGAGEAEDFQDVVEGDGFAGEADELFESGFGVAQAALGLAGDEDECLVSDLDLLGIGNFAEMGGDDGIRDAAEIEPLAAG